MRHLRQTGFRGAIYVFTVNIDPQNIAQCQAAGCNGHLAKPIDITQLHELFSTLKREKTK